MNVPFPRFWIEDVVLAPEVGDEQLGQAVAVDVLGVDPHPGHAPAPGVVAPRRRSRDVLERAVAPVEEEEIRVVVVGDVEVDPAVAVEVGGDHAEAVAVGPADPGRVGHVGEGPVAVVAVEDVPGRADRLGRAVASGHFSTCSPQ